MKTIEIPDNAVVTQEETDDGRVKVKIEYIEDEPDAGKLISIRVMES